MFQGDGSNGTSISASCPYSRMPVQIRPEWTGILLGGDHHIFGRFGPLGQAPSSPSRTRWKISEWPFGMCWGRGKGRMKDED